MFTRVQDTIFALTIVGLLCTLILVLPGCRSVSAEEEAEERAIIRREQCDRRIVRLSPREVWECFQDFRSESSTGTDDTKYADYPKRWKDGAE